MRTGAFDKPMTYSEAIRILTHALFADPEHLEYYEKDFDEWLSNGEKIHAVCAG